jgi:tetratricopeptide (TPR) repeat protein
MNIRWTIGMAVIVSSVAVPGAAGQVPGDASDPVRPYLERGEAYDLFIQALRLEDEGEIVQAVELLARAAELDAEAPAIPAAQAGLYARLDQATNAVEAAERALALDAEYVDAHRVLGLMFAALAEQAAGQSAGQRSANAESYRRRALTHLEQAAAGGVEDARVTFSLGRLLVETGAFDDAVAALEPFVRDRPGFVDGLLLLATAYAGAGRAVEATEALEEAVRGRPRSVRALSALAELY